MIYAPIKHTRFEIEHPRSEHRINAFVSRGWGSRVDSWALTMHGDVTLGAAEIHLGIDERSEGLHKLVDEMYGERINNLSYELKNATENKYNGDRTPGLKRVEHIAATLILRHMDSLRLKQPSPFNNEELVGYLVLAASQHRPTLQSVQFRDMQLSALRPLQVA